MSAKKVISKGKKKVGKPSGVVQIEEMNLVHEDEKQYMEVPAPSTKKRKTY